MTRVAIMIGGAAGAVARHAVSAWTVASGTPVLPWATLAVNISGSWALGLFMAVLPVAGVAPAVRAGLTIGFCGGFTTFSTFSLEVMALVREGSVPLALVYVAASVGLAVVGVFAGAHTGTLLMERRQRAAVPSRREAEDGVASTHPQEATRSDTDAG